MKCQKCNAEIPSNTRICLNCFTEINNGEKALPWRKKKLSKVVLPVCSVLFFIVLFASYSLYTNDFPNALANGGNFDYVETENAVLETENEKKTGFLNSIFQKPSQKDDLSDTQGTTSSTKPSVDEDETHKIESESLTESTTASAELTSDKPSGAAAVDSASPSTIGQIADSAENPAKVFEYVSYGNTGEKISITKYNGKASCVTVPDYINGLMVVEIQTGAFSDNHNIKTIDIVKGKRSNIYLRSRCFANCSSLETINLYDNNLGLSGDFAVNCPIKNFNITYWQYKFVNGALYSNNSQYWEFKYFAGNSCYSTLTLESWCKRISNDNNLSSAYNLKVINAHKDITYIPSSYHDYTTNLKAINVEEGNGLYYSKDGVLFSKSGLSSSSTKYVGFYPYSKKDKVFVMPEKEGYTFSLSGTYGTVINPYVEEIYLPKNASISLGSNESSFPSLKKLHYKSGHPDYEKVKFEFTGETSVY